VGGEVGAQHEVEGLREQDVAILMPFALAHEDRTRRQIHIAHLDPHEFPDPHRGEEQ
jgi:hypothetical protein